QQQRPHEIIKGCRVIEIDEAAEIAVPADVQPVVAAVLVEADPEEIDHLAERQRDHDEMDARGTQRHKADDERRNGGGAERGGEMDKAVGNTVKAEDADGVGADAEIGGVPEADEAAIPEDQIE